MGLDRIIGRELKDKEFFYVEGSVHGVRIISIGVGMGGQAVLKGLEILMEGTDTITIRLSVPLADVVFLPNHQMRVCMVTCPVSDKLCRFFPTTKQKATHILSKFYLH
jgi:hypothetical protein